MKSFMILIFSCLLTSQFNNVKAQTLQALDYNLNKLDGKMLIVDVYADWCGPCKRMDAEIFQNIKMKLAISKHFNLIKFNPEKDTYDVNWKGNAYKYSSSNKVHEFAQWAILDQSDGLAFPTIIVFDENRNIVGHIIGYKNPDEFLIYLVYYGSEDKWYQRFNDVESFAKYVMSDTVITNKIRNQIKLLLE